MIFPWNTGLTCGMPLLPSYSLLSEVSIQLFSFIVKPRCDRDIRRCLTLYSHKDLPHPVERISWQSQHPQYKQRLLVSLINLHRLRRCNCPAKLWGQKLGPVNSDLIWKDSSLHLIRTELHYTLFGTRICSIISRTRLRWIIFGKNHVFLVVDRCDIYQRWCKIISICLRFLNINTNPLWHIIICSIKFLVPVDHQIGDQ